MKTDKNHGPLLGMIIPLIFFLIIFRTFMPTLINDFTSRRKRAAWPEQSAEITRSAVRDQSLSYLLEVEYAYEVDGKRHTGSRFWPDESARRFKSIAEKRPLLARYARGTRHPVLVNPDNPGESVLKPEGGISPFKTLLPLLPVGIFLIIFLVIFIQVPLKGFRRRNRETFGPPPPPKKGTIPWPALIFLLIWGGGFLAGGILSLLLAGGILSLRPILFPVDTATWQAVEATVVKNGVRTERHHSKRGSRTSYYPYVAYTYTVGEQTYDNDRISPYASSMGARGSETFVQAYPVGKKITVYVNPAAPNESVISREGKKPIPQMVFGIIATLIGSMAIIGVIIATLKRLTADRAESDFSHPVPYATDPAVLGAAASGRPLRRITRQRVGLLLVFALFWNGILAFALVDNGILKPPFTWERLFFVPFIVVGVVLVILLIRAVLRLLVLPKLEIIIMDGRLAAGQTVQCTYRVTGDAGKLRNLAFRLERGSRYDTSEMQSYPVYLTENPVALQGGSFRMTLPATFTPDVPWTLDVKGETATLIDFAESYLV